MVVSDVTGLYVEVYDAERVDGGVQIEDDLSVGFGVSKRSRSRKGGSRSEGAGTKDSYRIMGW